MIDPFMLLALLMAAIVGGAVAWKYATWNLYRRPGAEWATDQIHPDRISRRLLARRKRQRLQIMLLTALLSPMLVYALLFGLELLTDIAHIR